MESVTIHNESSQTIYWASKRNPQVGKYDSIAAKSYISFEANPKEIWCKRTSDVGSPPEVVIDTIYWSDEQINATMSWWKKLFLGIFGVFIPESKEKAKQVEVPQDFIEIVPYEGKNGETQEEVEGKDLAIGAKKEEKKPPFLPFALPPPFPFKKKEG